MKKFTQEERIEMRRLANESRQRMTDGIYPEFINDELTEYLNTMPVSYRMQFIKAFEGKSKAAALKAKCIECANYQRTEVELCTVSKCPLYLYRPYK